MHSEPPYQLPPNAIKTWRISGLMQSLFLGMVCVIIWLLDTESLMPFWFLMTAAGAWLMLSVLLVGFIPRIKWKRWRYDINEHEIELQRGIFIVRRTLVPVNRVQHVDTRQGPVLRHYGLSAVTISTAATTHQIPALDTEGAEEARNRISRLALKAKEDV